MSNFKRIILFSLCSLLALGNSPTHEEMLIKIKRSIGQHLYEWRIYLNADKSIEENGKLVESLEDYVIPDIKFYSTPDLIGKPVAYINSKGYFEEGVQYCHRERALGSGMKKAIKYDFFYTPGSLESKLVCGVPALHIETSNEGPFYIVLDLKKIDKNIGHVRNGSSVMYMDITPFKDKPIIKPVNLQIREKYGDEVFKAIDGIITKLRTALMNKDIKTLNEFYYNNCVFYTSGFHDEKRKSKAIKKCKDDIYSRDSWFYKKSRMLYTLFYEVYNSRWSILRDDKIGLSTLDGSTGITFMKYNNKWILDEVDSSFFKNKGVL